MSARRRETALRVGSHVGQEPVGMEPPRHGVVVARDGVTFTVKWDDAVEPMTYVTAQRAWHRIRRWGRLGTERGPC